MGTGDKIEPGGWLKGEKRFKITKRKKDIAKPAPSWSDGWIGGSTESIYAAPKGVDNSAGNDGWIGGSSTSIYASQPGVNDSKGLAGWVGEQCIETSPAEATVPQSGLDTETPKMVQPRQLRKSRSGLSLSERLGMDELKEASKAEPMPNHVGAADKARHKAVMVEESTAGQRARPPHLTLPSRQEEPLRTPVAQTPLSATHPPPETPLKYVWRGSDRRADLPTTPGSDLAVQNATNLGTTGRSGGLLLDPGEGAQVLPVELQTPVRESFPAHPTEPIQIAPTTGKSQIDQMLAKLRLARSGPAPSVGTQESRWAVKEDKRAESSAPKDKNALMAASEKRIEEDYVAVPTAPRALREGLQAGKVGSQQAEPAKSLLERLSPVEATDAVEGRRSPKAKKERKRGSRKNETTERQSGTATPTARDGGTSGEPESLDLQHAVTSTGTEEQASREESPLSKGPPRSPQPDAAPATFPSSTVTVPRLPATLEHDHVENTLASALDTSPVAPSATLATSSTSASLASISTDRSTEGSNVGNGTLTSINWADDDDDDDALPDLPAEWIKGSQATTENECPIPALNVQPSITNMPAGSVEPAAPNCNPKRGAKRGGKGRARRDREGDGTQTVLPPSAPLGLRIAGSAAAAGAPRRELFPGGVQQPPRGPRADREAPARREPKAHGRPKLAVGNRDAFSRLARGAVGFAPSPVAEATNGAPQKGRNTRRTGAVKSGE